MMKSSRTHLQQRLIIPGTSASCRSDRPHAFHGNSLPQANWNPRGTRFNRGVVLFGSSCGFTFHHEDSLPDPGQDSRAASSQISRGLVNVCVVVKALPLLEAFLMVWGVGLLWGMEEILYQPPQIPNVFNS